MGLSGLEPPTSRLSGVRSNRLSYKPSTFLFNLYTEIIKLEAFAEIFIISKAK